MRSKKKRALTREKRQNARRKRIVRTNELRQQLVEEKKELDRLRQQWMRQKEQNLLMRLERRRECFEREGIKPPTNPTGLVRQKTNQRKKKQIDWARVNDWNKQFDDVVVDTERTRSIRWQ